MYKFANGKFKTYFVFSTNCVLLADELLHCKELDLIPIGGIVTPGTYLEFLNTEYLRPAAWSSNGQSTSGPAARAASMAARLVPRFHPLKIHSR